MLFETFFNSLEGEESGVTAVERRLYETTSSVLTTSK